MLINVKKLFVIYARIKTWQGVKLLENKSTSTPTCFIPLLPQQFANDFIYYALMLSLLSHSKNQKFPSGYEDVILENFRYASYRVELYFCSQLLCQPFRHSFERYDEARRAGYYPRGHFKWHAPGDCTVSLQLCCVALHVFEKTGFFQFNCFPLLLLSYFI